MIAPIVIKLGGLAVESPERAASVLGPIAEAARATPMILVHGGGKAVDEHLARLGIVSERREGLRVTSEREIQEIVGVLAGSVNKGIVGALHGLGAQAVGLCVGDGAIARARRIMPSGVDLGRVGEIAGGDARLLRVLLSEGFLPVLAPIGFDGEGQPLNINADDAAAGIAAIAGARMLVLLTDVSGVMDASKLVLESIDSARAETLIAEGVISGGMIPKVRAAQAAADRARAPAIISSWSDPEALAALLRGERRGTRFEPRTLTSGVAHS